MTLRARLIATVFVLAAVAMIALAAVTYAGQRGALLDQVDDQLASAQIGANQRLARQNGLQGIFGPGTPPPGARGPRRSYGADDPDDVGRGGGDLQPGTYAELRGSDGRKVGDETGADPAYNADALASPVLPTVLRAGMTFTATAKGDDDLRYRVRTFARPVGAFGTGRSPGGSGTSSTAGTDPGSTASSTSGADSTTSSTTGTTTATRTAAVRSALASGFTVVAVPLTDVDATLDRLLQTEGIVIGIALALLTGLSWVLVRIGLRPLDRMASTAGEIAAGDLDQRVEDASPRTEVGRLGLALNGMLGRLEGAFAEREASEGRLRQFLSDASHELRTPLASIRGYAELFRVGAVKDPEDLKKAMSRIEDEAARMGVLVEDLLVLARLDEAPEKAYGPVDVALIAEDVAEDARAIDPARTITPTGTGEAIVHGDDGQLRQVLTNLVRNALVHTPAGTPVEITTTVEGGHVEIEVRDHGQGLPSEDPQAIFGRFWRSEGGRTRGKSGAGLGLAIVAAIVEAHDGTVRAGTAPGGGASFVVRLPLRG
ncbi:cell wall metabolism sensor histidine kinase WalK [Patulibacter sp.]|uniref:sensor histidine kinase n=1 Tax=Patulibacter sp. TaxID=1912859 RepID=UPI00271D80D1|nr:HAMP domain-containing sensor histidine kinase [Patulibacter sp.]MDO9409096.1 HAMP domain-containing sensor histidine kinase [Patulibacter sp.]